MDTPITPVTQIIPTLIGNADAFPVLSHAQFFNHAGASPLPAVTAAAFRRYVDHAERHSYVGSPTHRRVEGLRHLCARLINAEPGEIAFVKNTSEGLATVAMGLPWQAGDRIVLSAVEYPSNVYPWFDLRQRLGVELVLVPQRIGDDGRLRVALAEILEETAHPRTRMVALSHVEFASGQRNDLAPIGRLCRELGKLFCVDAIQSLGAVPVDVQAMNIDFLAAGGQKWLLGPEGTAFMYIRRELMPRLAPLSVGWRSVRNADNFSDFDYTLRSDAVRYECGTHNVPGLYALAESVDLLLTAGIDAVAARLIAVTDHLIALLQSRGGVVYSPRGPGESSGIVSFLIPGREPEEVAARLHKQNTEIVIREGRLRASPHFYNTDQQMERLVEAIGA